MTRSLLRPAVQLLLLWLLLPPLPVPRVEARRSRALLPCPRVCEPTRCPPLPTCSAGSTPVLDRCRCCRVCAAAEGEACGGALGRPCAPGLQCRAPLSARRLRGAWVGTCGCPAAGAAVCGSDGRTYPSLCALRADNRAARLRGALPALPVLKGDCAGRGERGARDGSQVPKQLAAVARFAAGLPSLPPDSTPRSQFSYRLRCLLTSSHAASPRLPPQAC